MTRYIFSLSQKEPLSIPNKTFTAHKEHFAIKVSDNFPSLGLIRILLISDNESYHGLDHIPTTFQVHEKLKIRQFFSECLPRASLESRRYGQISVRYAGNFLSPKYRVSWITQLESLMSIQ